MIEICANPLDDAIVTRLEEGDPLFACHERTPQTNGIPFVLRRYSLEILGKSIFWMA